AAGIDQRTLRGVIAHQQRTESCALAGGIGETDDDEILALAAFRLEPARAAARLMPPVAALRDDALEPGVAGGGEEIRPLADLMVAVADGRLRIGGEHAAKRR